MWAGLVGAWIEALLQSSVCLMQKCRTLQDAGQFLTVVFGAC